MATVSRRRVYNMRCRMMNPTRWRMHDMWWRHDDARWRHDDTRRCRNVNRRRCVDDDGRRSGHPICVANCDLDAAVLAVAIAASVQKVGSRLEIANESRIRSRTSVIVGEHAARTDQRQHTVDIGPRHVEAHRHWIVYLQADRLRCDVPNAGHARDTSARYFTLNTRTE